MSTHVDQTKLETVMFYHNLSRHTFIVILITTGSAIPGCGNRLSNEQSTASAGNSNGTYKISTRAEPDSETGGKEHMFHVTVQDKTGTLVSDAQVHVTFTMPAMPLKARTEMKTSADLSWTGTDYSGPIPALMTGRWAVDVEVRRGREVMPRYQTYFHAN
jgi:hypothetical protein